MKMKQIIFALAALSTVLFATGAPNSCETKYWLDPDGYAKMQEPPEARISFHSIVKYRQGESTEQTIATYSGGEITIAANPYLTSRDIEGVEMLPSADRKGYYDLRLTLTNRGRKLWIGLSEQNYNEDVAFVIDGMFYRCIRPRKLQTDSDVTVVVDGPFDKATAMEIVANADFNYLKLNKK